MRSFAAVVLIVSCAGLSTLAPAQANRQKHPCDEAMSQSEMNICADKEYRKTDAELNKVYGRLMSRLDAAGKAKLKEAETAWIKYRDANCELEASPNHGGSLYPFVYAGCLARMTKARTAELKDTLEEFAPETKP